MNRNINGYKPMYLVSGFKMFHWLVLHECPTCNEKLEPRDPRERGKWADQAGEEIHTVPMMGWSNLSLDPECKYPPSLDAWMLKFSRNKWTKRNLNGQRGTISLSLSIL